MTIKTKTITSKISVSERETHIYRSGDGGVGEVQGGEVRLS